MQLEEQKFILKTKELESRTQLDSKKSKWLLKAMNMQKNYEELKEIHTEQKRRWKQKLTDLGTML